MDSTTDPLVLLASLAADLTASLAAGDRYDRVVGAVRRVLPCDAAVLLRLCGGELVPLAAHGLRPDALGRRFARADHPRLDLLCRADGPTRFPPDSPLPDPFDGLLAVDPDALQRIHACLGAPLRVHGELVGVLTADALAPDAFDRVDEPLLRALAALAGAAMHTSSLIEALQEHASRQQRVVRDLMRDVAERRGGDLLGRSPPVERLRVEIQLVARTDYPVLVTGETGTGKELVARALHASSARRESPLIYVNCAALPESIAESELFGHVPGAFTGADRERAGKFEVADGGTLFLDEVGELPASVQPKLLRALQQGEVQRIGSDDGHVVDVRVVAATNRDLESAVAAGRFRPDLFHRLNVYRLHVPPLRDRPGDVALLAGAFCDDARRRLGLGPVRLAADAEAALSAYAWPGNVRELENVVSRAVLRATEDVAPGDAVVVWPRHLGRDFAPSPPETETQSGAGGGPIRPRPSFREAIAAHERDLIRAAVERRGGNWAAAARDLGLNRSNLHRIGRRLGLC